MQDFNAMKSESKQMNRMKAVVLLLALACVNGYAQENNSSKGEDGSTSKEEGNRNVMLNAASANGPREIQIGLPSADVNVWRMEFRLLMPRIRIRSILFGAQMPA